MMTESSLLQLRTRKRDHLEPKDLRRFSKTGYDK